MARGQKTDKLKALREARKAKSSVIHADDSDSETGDIYDEVDEETFREHTRKRLLEDDFIVDDDGLGYVDNGVDEWDNRGEVYSDDSGNERDLKSTKSRSKRPPVKIKKTSQISNFFHPETAPKKTTVNANVDDILEDFLDSTPVIKKTKTNPFAAPSLSHVVKKEPKKAFNFSTTTGKRESKSLNATAKDAFEQPSSPVNHLTSDDDVVDMVKDEMLQEETPSISEPSDPHKPSSITQKSTDDLIVDEIEEDDDEDDSEEEIIVTRRPKVAASNARNVSDFAAVKASSLPSSSPSRINSHANISYTEKLDEASIIPDNSSAVKMFWLDYSEVDGTLLLYGKIETKEGKLVSGVVQINGMCRELYFLPRKYRKIGEEETDELVELNDVHAEVTPLLMQLYQLNNIRSKPETMKYSFEIPGVPKEAEYLKILLPFKPPKNSKLIMPSTLQGQTFLRMFGGNSSVFESFVLQRNIMGPCWLEIKNGDFDSIKNSSHCQVEIAINSPTFIKPIVDTKIPSPHLNLTSIAVQTTLTSKNVQEIVSVSIATFRNVPQDSLVNRDRQPDEIVTLVRPIGSVAVPPGLSQLAEKQKFNLKVLPNEKTLLNCLAALIKTADPDVFIGHRLEAVSLDILIHRMYDLKCTTWSTFGRRNRKAWPDRFGMAGGAFSNSLQLREIFQGRLLCDIANEMGQSLTPKCQSWDLPEMLQVVCHKKQTPLEVNFNNERYAEDAGFLLLALKDVANNVRNIAEIGFEIQILSLSKQLTNLAGNAWSHTLSGTRAGRNEYILLHEFKRQGYIVPDKEDKYQRAANQQQQAKLEANEEDATTQTSNKKPKFQGGLVFEPEKGLHKNYILVMDFNSLYPSIIQEFNICFTTVERDQFNITHDEDHDMPSLPEKEFAQGVLPRLLSSLVSRRREVKKLLKNPNNTADERTQFDIKQQALKLTANSMYGCLGYVNSRFYAKPLAMMVTNKGREILMDTRQLAESIGLRVVYGDTDSVMIDTGADSYSDAIKIGEEFKVQVNERYKLLEIDIDNVFKRLLLHAKKKYAAMNVSINSKTGEEISQLEVKGLDLRRREYCQVSKDISTYVLEKILSDIDPEQALSEVYAYLEDMTAKIKANSIAMDRFKINTRLSKDPKNYPNGKNMPAVKVALRLREEGKVIKAGTVITFVITAPSDGDTTSSAAERARAIQEVLRKNANMKPDADYYLEKQIFAPVERLVERIEGIDMMRIASSLGMDTKKYALRVRNSDHINGDIKPLESNISDTERFRQCSYLVLNCTCGHKFRFGGILSSNDYKVTYNGINCGKCEYNFPWIRVNAQLEYAIRNHISAYYAGWLVCDDSACGITTRQISVYGKRCIGTSGRAFGCKGIMKYKYSDKALYNQLLYFAAIFDVDKAKKNLLRPIIDDLETEGKMAPKLVSGQVEALSEQNRDNFGLCSAVVDKYLDGCGRRYIDMGSIFDFMK